MLKVTVTNGESQFTSKATNLDKALDAIKVAGADGKFSRITISKVK